MSIATQLCQLADSKNDIKMVLTEKGVDVENFNFNNLSTLMENMSGDSSDIEIPMIARTVLVSLQTGYNPYEGMQGSLYLKDENSTIIKSCSVDMSDYNTSTISNMDLSLNYHNFKMIDQTIVFAVKITEGSTTYVHVFVSRNNGSTWNIIKQDIDNNPLGPYDNNQRYGTNIVLNSDSFALNVSGEIYVSDDFQTLKKINKTNFNFEIHGNEYQIENISKQQSYIGDLYYEFGFKIQYDSNKYCYTSDFKVFNDTFEKPNILDNLKETSYIRLQDDTIVNNFKEATNNQTNEYNYLCKYNDLYVMQTYSTIEMYGPQSFYIYISNDGINWTQVDTDRFQIATAVNTKTKYFIILSQMWGDKKLIISYNKDLTNKTVVSDNITGNGTLETIVMNLDHILVYLRNGGEFEALTPNNSNIVKIKRDGTYTKNTMTKGESKYYVCMITSGRTIPKRGYSLRAHLNFMKY